MPIMPPFTRKKQPPAAPGAVPEEPNPLEEENEDGESASDIDAPKMAGSKPNPLKMWAQARAVPK